MLHSIFLVFCQTGMIINMDGVIQYVWSFLPPKNIIIGDLRYTICIHLISRLFGNILELKWIRFSVVQLPLWPELSCQYDIALYLEGPKQHLSLHTPGKTLFRPHMYKGPAASKFFESPSWWASSSSSTCSSIRANSSSSGDPILPRFSAAGPVYTSEKRKGWRSQLFSRQKLAEKVHR